MRVRFALCVTLAMAAGACRTPEPSVPEYLADGETQRAFWADPATRERLDAFVLANTRFALLHELAHHLIDVLDLPVAGREEDAADRLAALLMQPTGPGSGPEDEVLSSANASALVWVAYAWINSGQDVLGPERQRMVWYDAHSVGPQRGFDILCLTYGSNPERFALTVQDPEIGIPDQARLRNCIAESQSNARTWQQLLGPHLRTAEEAARLRTPSPRPDQMSSGSASAAILKGAPADQATPVAMLDAVQYRPYDTPETWMQVPWMPWSSPAFLRSHRTLETVRDALLEIRLPEGVVTPSFTAHSCNGVPNAYYGLDIPPEMRALAESGLLSKSIVICYPLVDGYAWMGRSLIWRSAQTTTP